MQRLRAHMQVSVAPGHQFAIVPGRAVAIVEARGVGRSQGVNSLNQKENVQKERRSVTLRLRGVNATAYAL
jgi:hypothetical protein